LERYADAVAQDMRRPSERVRNAARAHAQMLRDQAAMTQRAQSVTPPKPAANQPQWTISLVASLAVMGLVGLLYVQIDRGTPEVRDAALGTGTRNETVAAQPAAPPPAAASPAPAARVDAAPTDQTSPHGSATGAVAKATPPTAAPRDVPLAPAKELAPSTSTAAQAPPPAQLQPEARAAAAKAYGAPVAEADSMANTGASRDAKRSTSNTESTLRAAPAAAMAPVAPAPAVTAMAAPPAAQLRARDAGVAPAAAQFLDAVRTGQLDATQRLLAQGVAINTRDDQGNTALMLAVRHQQVPMARKLLEWGADASLLNHEGKNALQLANQLGLADMAQLLQTPR
jgi:hypothetical protein